MVVGNPSLQPHPRIYCVNWYFITIWWQCGLLYSRGPQPPGCGPLLGHGLFRNKPHEQHAGAHVHACVAHLQKVKQHTHVHIPWPTIRDAGTPLPPPQPGHQVANVEDCYFIVKCSGQFGNVTISHLKICLKKGEEPIIKLETSYGSCKTDIPMIPDYQILIDDTGHACITKKSDDQIILIPYSILLPHKQNNNNNNHSLHCHLPAQLLLLRSSAMQNYYNRVIIMEKTLILLAGCRTLTIIHRVTEGARADHALGSVCQGEGAAHGGGVVELEGGVMSRNAVRTGDPWGVGCRGTHCRRRGQGEEGVRAAQS